MSVSRRASLQRKESQKSGSVLTMPTEDIFNLGTRNQETASEKMAKGLFVQVKEVGDDKTELMANSPTRPSQGVPPFSNRIRPSSIPPVPPLPISFTKSPPEPAYIPGGWRDEWNNVDEEVGTYDIPHDSTDGSTTNPSTYWSSSYSSTDGSSQKPLLATKKKDARKTHRRRTASTSITSSSQHSGLTAAGYASEPEVAVRQAIRVVPNPAYPGAQPRPVAQVQAPQRVQKKGQARQELRRKPSNFSRKIPPRSRGSEVVDSAADYKSAEGA